MKPKTLTLLILTAIVMASVACGPSTKELKQVALCEDAIERRALAEKRWSEVRMLQSRGGATKWDLLTDIQSEREKNERLEYKLIQSITGEVEKYCKQ